MPFVKLDCGILNSSLWIDKPARDIFVTALLLAEPEVYDNPIQQLSISDLKHTGWSAPPGWYGFVAAASTGLIARSGVSQEEGHKALERLGEADLSSRSNDYEGRRMIRIDGGFIILNYNKYRERDYTGAERQRRWRERRRNALRNVTVTLPRRYITQAEAEVHSSSESEGNGVMTLEHALKWLSRAKESGADYTEEETKKAYLALEAGGWMWGSRPIVDPRAALERQIQTDRDRLPNRNNGKPSIGKMPLGLQAEALKKAIGEHPANRESVCYTENCTEADRRGLKEMRAKLKDIETNITKGIMNGH